MRLYYGADQEPLFCKIHCVCCSFQSSVFIPYMQEMFGLDLYLPVKHVVAKTIGLLEYYYLSFLLLPTSIKVKRYIVDIFLTPQSYILATNLDITVI